VVEKPLRRIGPHPHTSTERFVSSPVATSVPRNRLLHAAFVATVLLLAAACGGQATDALDHGAAAATAARVTSTTYVLTSIDGQTTSPYFTCTSAGTTEAITGGSITLASNGSFTAIISETETQNGAVTQQTYQLAGKYTQSGSAVTLRYSNGTVVPATLSGNTLTITGLAYCGGTHDLVFQKQ
jgi:hypothetical protein